MIYKAKDPVYFIGDLHGNFHWLKEYIEKYDITDCTMVICGDGGLGFMKLSAVHKKLRDEIKLIRTLRKRKILVFFVRGNHDNPNVYDGKSINFRELKAIEDYSVISTPKHNILCIGGGVSPDRFKRKLEIMVSLSRYMKYHPFKTREEAMNEINLHYWENEVPVYRPDLIDQLTCQIDTVCTHIAPTFFPPGLDVPKKYLGNDKELRKDCITERRILDKVYSRLTNAGHPVTKWFYGHYHYYAVSQYRQVTGYLLDKAKDGNLSLKELDYDYSDI